VRVCLFFIIHRLTEIILAYLSFFGWLLVGRCGRDTAACGKFGRTYKSTHTILNLLKLVGNDIKTE
jgi:hypothetical protein